MLLEIVYFFASVYLIYLAYPLLVNGIDLCRQILGEFCLIIT